MTDFVGSSKTAVKAHLGARYILWGNQFAIALTQRSADDLHVCLQILSEDDGNWFLGAEAWSSVWLPDLQRELRRAELWMEKYCTRDTGEWGFRFKRPARRPQKEQP